MATQTTKITESQLKRIVGKMVAEAMQKEDLSWDPQHWTEDDVDQYRAAQKRGENVNSMVGPSGVVDAMGRPVRADNAPTDECGGGNCGLSNEAINHLTERVMKTIRESLSELGGGELDEGFFDQLKQGAKSFFGNGYGADNPKNYRNSVADRQARGEHTANWLNGTTPMNLKQRWNAAKTGYQQQGNIDNAVEIAKTLDNIEKLVGTSLGKQGINFNKMTIGQLKSYLGRAEGTAKRRVSNANNAIYKGQQMGVMGSGRTATV